MKFTYSFWFCKITKSRYLKGWNDANGSNIILGGLQCLLNSFPGLDVSMNIVGGHQCLLNSLPVLGEFMFKIIPVFVVPRSGKFEESFPISSDFTIRIVLVLFYQNWPNWSKLLSICSITSNFSLHMKQWQLYSKLTIFWTYFYRISIIFDFFHVFDC